MPPPRLIFVLLDLCLRDWRSPERQKKIPNRFYRGMPRVSRKKRGPLARWYSCSHCGKNTIHFHRPNIAANKKKKNTNLHVLSAKRGTKTLAKGHEIEIHGPCKIVYRPNKPHSCGATVWIETLATATMLNFDGTGKKLPMLQSHCSYFNLPFH